MFERNKDFGGTTVICDECGDFEDYDEEDWSELSKIIKEDGWQIKKDGDWLHICPSCVE
ncbi:MAG: hypothetical protein WC774_05565 [Candidatus Gracilibacteria bacterium]|jgi:hypothetical protein